MKPRPAARLSRERWIDAALALLARGGTAAVEVEPLARSLRVTKGSFYWHFRDRQDLLAASLRRWEGGDTLNVRGRVEAGGGTALERLRRLFSIAIDRRTLALEVALRQWARQDARARRAVVRVDASRIAYVRALYLESGLPAREAEPRALLAYAALLGEAFIASARRSETPERLRRRAIEALLAGVRASAPRLGGAARSPRSR
jgi:AcrR family transcriptional regulator